MEQLYIAHWKRSPMIPKRLKDLCLGELDNDDINKLKESHTEEFSDHDLLNQGCQKAYKADNEVNPTPINKPLHKRIH